MLSEPAPFPHVGSTGFLAGTGQPARILQRRGDGRLLVSLTGVSPHDPDLATRAGGNKTVAPADLHETRESALGLATRAKRVAMDARRRSAIQAATSGPQARTGARSSRGAAANSGEDAPAGSAAEPASPGQPGAQSK